MKSILLIALLSAVSIANATEITLQGGNALAGASAIANGGNVNAPAADYGDLRIVPPAIAPNVNTSIICPIVQQGSKAGSVFFFSGSGTTSPEINAICLAWHQNDKEMIHAIACTDSSSYRKASEKLGRSCK